MEQSSTRPVTDSRTARRKINQHLWKFHDHAVGQGDTLSRYIFHETLHADSDRHDGSAGKPRHVHMSETDLDVIATIDE